MPPAKSTASDAALMAAARDDPDAFRDVYRRYAERVHGYFLRRTRNEHAAIELTAETFAQAWLIRSRFRDERDGTAGPWLFGIARNVLLMSLRRGEIERQATVRLGLRDELDRAFGVADVLPTESWGDGADELLDALPAAQREAVQMRVIDELPYDEIASTVGITTEAARVRVHRGLAALRARLTPTTHKEPVR